MNKRGQVTIFIIISIVLIAVAGFFFLLENKITLFKTDLDPEIREINEFISDCLKENSEKALLFIGEHGGYAEIPEESINYNIPYYYYDGQNTMPSKKEIENQISSYLMLATTLCEQEFVEFREFEINSGDAEIQTTIQEEVVKFQVHYPIQISKNGTIYELDYFEYEILNRLNIIYETVSFIVQKQKQDPGSICINCILDKALENNLRIEIEESGSGNIFTIIDETIEEYKMPFKFKFAMMEQ